MTLHHDDPRFTAQVIGEVDPALAQPLQEALGESDAARQTAEEIREVARLLTEALQEGRALELTAAQRQAIERKAGDAEVIEPAPRISRRRSLVATLVLAASLVLVAGLLLFRRESPARVATADRHAKPPQAESAARLTGPSVEASIPPSPPALPRLKAHRSPTPPSVVGTVRDPSGAVIPGASIHVTELRSGKTQVARSTITVAAATPLVTTQSSALSPKGAVVGGVVGSLPDSLPFSDSALMVYKTKSKRRRSLAPGATFNTEAYDRVVDNSFLDVGLNPLSTFSIDVDTASYANIRRFLKDGELPPPDAVRIEEMLNSFSYDDSAPTDKRPFAAHVEIAAAPWNQQHRLVRIGLKGSEVALERRPPSNLVFLVDVSGSMNEPNKLPLVKRSLQMLVQKLAAKDHIAIVVYAGASGLALPSTSCDHKDIIAEALEGLEAGGSTNGGAGIQLAYDMALAHFIEGGTNRVILATDGDFNVGVTDQGRLIRLIEEKAKSGVFLTVLGFGMGNYKDSTLEKLADKGNGHYAYIDTDREARKVLVEQITSTLVNIAKDVKVQVEFNPARAAAYRLIGYENRLLRAEDFADDTKDAGEIGAGHTVTALYEVVPPGTGWKGAGVDALKYQTPSQPAHGSSSGELLTLKLRYKEPHGRSSQLMEMAISDRGNSLESSTTDFKFAAAVAAFGMMLRNSPYKGDVTVDRVLECAHAGLGLDPLGYRAEFIDLVNTFRELKADGR